MKVCRGKNDVLSTVVDDGLNSLPTEGHGRSYMYSSRAGPVAAVGVCGSEDRAPCQLMRYVGCGQIDSPVSARGVKRIRT
jgi:hypothetical protein